MCPLKHSYSNFFVIVDQCLVEPINAPITKSLKRKINNLTSLREFDRRINIKCVGLFLRLKTMEALSEEVDDDSDVAENRLLKTEGSGCVCSKGWEKGFICGWAPSFERKISRKPTKHASLSNTRKDGKLPRAECGFVFRHYEKTSRYIEQYRENHSSAFLERGEEWRPVLGVDVPDPYLPKVGSSR